MVTIKADKQTQNSILEIEFVNKNLEFFQAASLPWGFKNWRTFWLEVGAEMQTYNHTISMIKQDQKSIQQAKRIYLAGWKSLCWK